MKKLADLADVTVGFVGTMTPFYRDTGVPFLRSQNVTPHAIDLSDMKFIDPEFDQTIRKSALSPGDVVIVRTGKPGIAAVIPDSIEHANCADLVVVRPGPELNSQWFSYFMNSVAKHAVAANTVGAVHQHFNVGATKALEIPDVGLSEQVRVAKVLGALDDKIAANREIIGASVALATQTVGREAVGPDRPLSEIADVQMGSSPRGADLNEDGDGMEFYQGVRDFGELSPTPRVFATVTPRRAMADDTLLAVRAPVGEVNWARHETCIGRGLAAVRSVATPTTVHYLLRRFANRWDEHEGSGTVFSSVTGPQVKDMRFPTVPEASAAEVEQLLASIHQRALSAEVESAVLARTRDELLPLLMNGRIAVKDAERVAEAVL